MNQFTTSELTATVKFISKKIIKNKLSDISFENAYSAIYHLCLKNPNKCAALFYKAISSLNDLDLDKSDYDTRLTNLNDLFFYLRRVHSIEAIDKQKKDHFQTQKYDRTKINILEDSKLENCQFHDLYRAVYDLCLIDPNTCAAEYYKKISTLDEEKCFHKYNELLDAINDSFMYLLRVYKIKMIVRANK
jgi:hypothetical protein